MTVTGPGMLDVSYWRQENSLAAHLVNLTNPMAMKGYMREILPVGPHTVSLELPPGRTAKGARLLESGATVTGRQTGNRFVVDVPRVQVHEVVAVDLV